MCEWLIRKGKIYDYRSKYSEANQEYDKALQIIPDQGEESLSTKIKLSKAITLIKARDYKAAVEILSIIKPMYKAIKQYKSVTICTVLLSECALSEGDNKEFEEQYNGAI